ncbi:MAG: tetratricopeptide repeat protein [Syntrophobacteraceae bacterium]|jgi:tetratricopeptide (TPR) repeat protein|nr:tetratricopeptide repeat protein [Syntrophobacteraceae bacterium]
MKCSCLRPCILVLFTLAMTGPVPTPAGAGASPVIQYTFHPCEIDSKHSSRIIALERVKRILASEMAENLEQGGRLRQLGVDKDGAAALLTLLVQVETVHEKWDGTVYTLTARPSGGTDDLLKVVRLVRQDWHIEQELVLSAKRAEVILQEIDEINREHREARVERPRMYRYYRSLEELEAVSAYARGLTSLAGGRLSDAVEILTEVINRAPGDARLYHYRGVAHARMGDEARALMDYDRAIALDRHYAAPHLGRGEVLHGQGRHEEALAEIQSAVSIDPNLAEAYLLRGIVHDIAGKNRHAIDDLTRAIALDPGLAIAYVHRGNAYSKRGYHRQAFGDFHRAISLDSRMWIAHFHAGELHQRRRSFSKARDEYSRVIEINDRCSLAYANRGRVHSILGEEEKALEDFARAIELDPSLAMAYFNRGLTHMKLGHMDQALDDQKVAARLGWKAAQDFLSAKGIKW